MSNTTFIPLPFPLIFAGTLRHHRAMERAESSHAGPEMERTPCSAPTRPVYCPPGLPLAVLVRPASVLPAMAVSKDVLLRILEGDRSYGAAARAACGEDLTECILRNIYLVGRQQQIPRELTVPLSDELLQYARPYMGMPAPVTPPRGPRAS